MMRTPERAAIQLAGPERIDVVAAEAIAPFAADVLLVPHSPNLRNKQYIGSKRGDRFRGDDIYPLGPAN